MSKALRLLLVTAAATILVVVTWVVAVRFQAPAQKEAAAQPPAAQPVLGDVTRGDLTQQTTLNATASPATSVNTPLNLPEGVVVVTAPGATVGDSLTSGQVVTWINDRPVIALKGAFPLYRDLTQGDSGTDVRMLQAALLDQGCDLALDGVFGNGTANCLQRLYRQLGAQPPTRTISATDSNAAGGAAGAPKDTTQAAPSAGSQGDTAASSKKGAAQAQGAKTQLYLPLTEAVVVADLPARAEQLPAVGTVLNADNATITLSQGGTSLSATIPGSVAAKLVEGAKGTATLGSEQVAVRITSIKTNQTTAQGNGEQSGGQGEAVQGKAATGSDSMSTITLAEDGGTFPDSWAGHNDILVALNLIEPLTGVLKIPQRAIAAAADGTSTILVQTRAGAFGQVKVTPTSCVEGICALEEPTASPLITEGAKVRVDR